MHSKQAHSFSHVYCLNLKKNVDNVHQAEMPQGSLQSPTWSHFEYDTVDQLPLTSDEFHMVKAR